MVIDSLSSGGAQRQIVTLARGLKSRGHHVEFFTYYPHDHYLSFLQEDEIPVHVHLKQSRFSIALIKALRQILRTSRFDLVLAFLALPSLYAELACIGLGETKLVVSERFMYGPGRLSFTTRVLQALHCLADAITVNSHHQYRRMLLECSWMSSKLQTIYNGVDLLRFSPGKRREVGSNNALNLIAIGTIVAKKNALNLARALTICRDCYNLKPVVRWVGKQDYSKAGCVAFTEVSGFIEANGLNEQWEWLGERRDIPDLLRKHDALIHPSFFEGLPNAICEALGCGLPVLASNVCDHPNLIFEGVSGFLYNPHSPDSIAEAIYNFHVLPLDKKRGMGANARRFAEENLSDSLLTSNYERLFLSLVESKSSA